MLFCQFKYFGLHETIYDSHTPYINIICFINKYCISRYRNSRNGIYNVVLDDASIKSLIIAVKIWTELDVPAYEDSQ